MEINKIDGEITGVVPVADVVEGRFGVFCAHTHDFNYGSKTDLPGFKVPATAEEAKNAHQVITWAVDNQKYPMWKVPQAFTYAFRRGYSVTQSDPMTGQTVYLSNPAAQNGITIPSGMPSLAFGKGTYTVPSGAYIYAAGITVMGALVQVANTAEDTSDAGKLKLLASMSDRKVGTVREYVASTGALTVDLD